MAVIVAALALSGCTLNRQIPKASIVFNPVTHELQIHSHKDVVMSNVLASITGTNATIRIGYYAAQNNIAVVQAAIQAQQQQIAGVQKGLEMIVGAAVQNAKP